jgi:hypothetical protein
MWGHRLREVGQRLDSAHERGELRAHRGADPVFGLPKIEPAKQRRDRIDREIGVRDLVTGKERARELGVETGALAQDFFASRRYLGLVSSPVGPIHRLREQAPDGGVEIRVRLHREPARACSLGQRSGQQRPLWKTLLEVLEDGARLPQHEALVLDDRHLAARVLGQKIRLLEVARLKRDQTELVRKLLVLEREPDLPRGGRAGSVGERERHGACL